MSTMPLRISRCCRSPMFRTALALLLMQSGRSLGDDWPMFGRDRTHNGVSPEKNPPLSWQIEDEPSKRPGRNIKWVAELGSHTYGDPVVADGLVWVGTNNQSSERLNDEDASVLLCLREADGKPLYRYVSPRLDSHRHDWRYSSMASSPFVEKDRLWFVTNRAEVVCLDIGLLRRGEGEPRVVWKVDMFDKWNVRPYASDGIDTRRCSPAVYKDWLFVNTGESVARDAVRNERRETPSLVCLDKSNGRLVWKDNSPGEAILLCQSSSPLVAEIGGRAQVIMPQGDGWVRSFDPATGKLLWEFDMNPKEAVLSLRASDQRNSIPATPVLFENHIFLANGRSPEMGNTAGRFCCFDATRRGDISSELAVDSAGKAVPHRRIQAVDVKRGEKAIANPNSGLVWEFTGSSGTDEEQLHGTVANAAVADGLVAIPDACGYVHCLDAKTGRLCWTYDALASIYASPLIVDGYIYIADDDGDVAILRLSADPKIALPYGKPLAEMNVGNSVYCSPVFANGTLYIASRNRLFAIRDASKQPGQ